MPFTNTLKNVNPELECSFLEWVVQLIHYKTTTTKKASAEHWQSGGYCKCRSQPENVKLLMHIFDSWIHSIFTDPEFSKEYI